MKKTESKTPSAGNRVKKLPAFFFAQDGGIEPVKEWLSGLSKDDKKRIGEDIKTVELGWPIGMPVCRKITGHKLWEVRTDLSGKRIARILWFELDGRMWLLHGFIKKSRKTPQTDLNTATERMKQLKKIFK